MLFTKTLVRGKFLKRYKRFFADIQTDSGEVLICHNPNTGTMKTCIGENFICLASDSNDPTRKLRYTLELTHNGKTWIGVNTSMTNHLAIEAIKNGVISELQGFSELIPEKKIGDSRIDILLKTNDQNHYVEVKNVTLLIEENIAAFPDAVTERGQKHLNELIHIVKSGQKATMLFIVNRGDCEVMQAAHELDPTYSNLLKVAHESGVQILAYQTEISEKEVKVTKRIPVLI